MQRRGRLECMYGCVLVSLPAARGGCGGGRAFRAFASPFCVPLCSPCTGRPSRAGRRSVDCRLGMQSSASSAASLFFRVKELAPPEKHAAIDAMLASYEKKDIDKKELNGQLISMVGKEVLASALKALVPEMAKQQPAEPRAFRWRALHELLKEDVPSDALERKLAEQHSQLLRTLERTASADGSSNTVKRPAFPAPTGSASSDVHVRACSSLLQLDEAATLKLLKSFEAEAYNDAQALRKANEAQSQLATPALALGAAPAAVARRSSAKPVSGALPSHLRLELALLQVIHGSSYCSLLTTQYPPLTTHHSPRTTHHAPLTPHPSPLTTHFSLPALGEGAIPAALVPAPAARPLLLASRGAAPTRELTAGASPLRRPRRTPRRHAR